MASTARHRRDPHADRTPVSFDPPIEVRTIDFDAVAPMRRPEPWVPRAEAREESGDGPAQYVETTS